MICFPGKLICRGRPRNYTHKELHERRCGYVSEEIEGQGENAGTELDEPGYGAVEEVTEESKETYDEKKSSQSLLSMSANQPPANQPEACAVPQSRGDVPGDWRVRCGQRRVRPPAKPGRDCIVEHYQRDDRDGRENRADDAFPWRASEEGHDGKHHTGYYNSNNKN